MPILLFLVILLTACGSSTTPGPSASPPSSAPATSTRTSSTPAATGNRQILTFAQAKKLALKLHAEHPVTIYCPCRYEGKTIDLRSCGYRVHKDARRAARLEWEHVVPAQAFGQAFPEWREGAPECVNSKGRPYRGRRCAEKNEEFQRMEADLYNLWPIDGELNGLRNDYSMEAISGPALTFGGCQAKVQDRKFEPMDEYKGIVARTYLYMNENYPGRGIVSGKNEKLFAAWDKMYPVSDWECRRAAKIRTLQGNADRVVEIACAGRGKAQANP